MSVPPARTGPAVNTPSPGGGTLSPSSALSTALGGVFTGSAVTSLVPHLLRGYISVTLITLRLELFPFDQREPLAGGLWPPAPPQAFSALSYEPAQNFPSSFGSFPAAAEESPKSPHSSQRSLGFSPWVTPPGLSLGGRS